MGISVATKNVLWGKSRDQCAFPGCVQSSSVENSDATSGDVFYTPVLEHAHIRSKKPDGPRYDPDYPSEKLDSFDNLILLCPTHHGPVVDAENGRAFTAKDLEKMRNDHIAAFDRLDVLKDTLLIYLGEQFGADDKVLFEQAQLRGPTVESMFVDVPFTCRSDASVADVLKEISARHPGDFEATKRSDGQPVTGAAQALLSPQWRGNALLVGGPGQGKSTLLQYVCQFHRSRLLDKSAYAGDDNHLDLSHRRRQIRRNRRQAHIQEGLERKDTQRHRHCIQGRLYNGNYKGIGAHPALTSHGRSPARPSRPSARKGWRGATPFDPPPTHVDTSIF